jgi:hypothetical protein
MNTRLSKPRSLGLLAGVSLLALLTACGPSLSSMTVEAMDLCIETRNPLFVGGRGAQALDTPLPARAEELAGKMNYLAAFKIYRDIAEQASSQVILVCALDYASRYRDAESTALIRKYLKHPDEAVSVSAQRLLR